MKYTFKALSIIFDYPGDQLESLANDREALRDLLAQEDPEAARLIDEFLAGLDLKKADEDYVAVFEMPPKCSLYAHTYLLKGKEDMVGQLLLEVKSHYKGRLVDVPVEREIPTYLPVMLEYLAYALEKDPAAARRFARKYLKPWITQLRECLEKNNSQWAKPAKALEIAVEKIAKQ